MTAFFRTYLGKETDFIPILTATAPPPASAMTDELFVSFHAPDEPAQRLDVNRLLEGENLTTNTLGGAVMSDELMPYDLCGGEYGVEDCLPEESDARQPHTTNSYLAPDMVGLSQLEFGWNSEMASYTNLLPVGSQDVSGYSLLQFRVSVNFTDDRNQVDVPQDFTVMLTDGSGNSSATSVSEHSAALFYPPGELKAVPKVVLNTVPIPLDTFADVDLADIQSVRFDFDRRPEGALLLTDIAFSKVDGSPGPVTASADLSVSMTDEPDPVRVDKELKYSITVVNAGPDETNNVILTDNLPYEVTFKEASDECSYANNSITCPPISLQVGQTEEYEFTVIVDETPSDRKLENTVSVSADQDDPDNSDNTTTVTTRVLGGGGKPQ